MHTGKLGRMGRTPGIGCAELHHRAAQRDGYGFDPRGLQRWLVEIDRKTARSERNRSYRQALPQAERVSRSQLPRNLPIA
jgi:hypothetical protein